jgi:hypothetical protein
MRLLIAIPTLLLLATPVMAAGCDDYPFTQGINVEDVNGGIRIISTAEVSVSFDDIDSIKDARDEATLEAKSLISGFMSEGIRSDQTINKAVQETKSMQGEAKTAVRNEVIERVKRLGSSTQSLLHGAVPLGECYTKGKVFRVSVGIKPETIAQAEKLSGGMSKSHANQPRFGSPAPPSGGVPPSPSQSPSGVDSYSHTKELNKF